MSIAAPSAQGVVAARPGSTVVASPPIPFRKTPVASTPEVFGVFAMTLLVLAAFYAAAWYARRRGWLDRWVGARPSDAAAGRKMAVIERLPISRKTVLYRVSHGGQEYLLAESTSSVQLSCVAAPVERQP